MLDLVLLRSNSGAPLIAFQCLPSCVLPRLASETLRVRDRSTSPSASSSYQVRGSIYHAYNFQLTVPSSRIERLLDPTTYTYASHMKPQTAMSLHIPANHVRLCYFARCSATASMHARMLYTLPPVTPWFGLSHYYYYYCG